jgi:hypothetical protein
VRVALIALALFTSLGAAGGAVMLITTGLGDQSITETRLGALGFTSWAPGGVLLALGVSLPMAVAGAMVWADHPWGPMVALLAGLALICWIIVQVTMIGFSTWLQPVFFLVGATVTSFAMLVIRAAP